MRVSQLILCLFLLGSSTGKSQSNPTQYLDVEGNAITRSEFEELRSTNEYLDVFDEAKNEKRLIERTYLD